MLIAPKLYRDIKYYTLFHTGPMLFVSTLIIGQLILSGQFSIPTVEDEVNISQIPDRSREVVVDYFMTNNFTLTDNLTNVSSGSLCSSEAAQIRDVLTTYTSLEIFCVPECGQKSTEQPSCIYIKLSFFFYSFVQVLVTEF